MAGTAGSGDRTKWRSPTAFLIVLTVVVGYVLHYVHPDFAPPTELIPFGLLAAGYLFGVDYENLVKKNKEDKDER